MPDRLNIIVGVSDAKTANSPEHLLITYSLGSCIGVTLFDPIAKVGGMLHFQLPSSSADPQRASERPFMYADTGMSWLIGQMERMGANKRRMKVRIAGGAQLLDDQRIFDIGRRNHTAIKKIFFQHGMFIDSEQVGGKAPRTLALDVSSGVVTIRSNGEVQSFS